MFPTSLSELSHFASPFLCSLFRVHFVFLHSRNAPPHLLVLSWLGIVEGLLRPSVQPMCGEELKNKFERASKEHFDGWSDAAFSLMRHEGRSLRRRLMDDMQTRKRNTSAARLSSSNYLRAVCDKSEVDASDPWQMTRQRR